MGFKGINWVHAVSFGHLGGSLISWIESKVSLELDRFVSIFFWKGKEGGKISHFVRWNSVSKSQFVDVLGFVLLLIGIRPEIMVLL